jgi:prepilin signal peptidase PulO-like enzyme (type II secretory pathway)
LLAIILALSIADVRQMILPDRLNGLLAVGGIGQILLVGQPGFVNAGLGALLGFTILASTATLFRHVRGVDGLGEGDQKFAAAAGLWIGWQQIAPMLLMACCAALLFVAGQSVKKGTFDRTARVPFGPFLGLATVICWLMVATGAGGD